MNNEKYVELAVAVKEMRDAQRAYFASKKASRYGDKKALALSKKLEGDVDRLIEEGIDSLANDIITPDDGPDEPTLMQQVGHIIPFDIEDLDDSMLLSIKRAYLTNADVRRNGDPVLYLGEPYQWYYPAVWERCAEIITEEIQRRLSEKREAQERLRKSVV